MFRSMHIFASTIHSLIRWLYVKSSEVKDFASNERSERFNNSIGCCESSSLQELAIFRDKSKLTSMFQATSFMSF